MPPSQSRASATVTRRGVGVSWLCSSGMGLSRCSTGAEARACQKSVVVDQVPNGCGQCTYANRNEAEVVVGRFPWCSGRAVVGRQEEEVTFARLPMLRVQQRCRHWSPNSW